MKERPILFSAPMVRALLDGSKTQTRRVMKAQPYSNGFHFDGRDILCHNDYLPPAALLMDVKRGKDQYAVSDVEGDLLRHCPYGEPEDRLWVRETWMADPPIDDSWPSTQFAGCRPRDHSLIPDIYRKPGHCLYRATWAADDLHGWTPAIHMYRWASRITLEVIDVRVERLNAISAADCIAEGAPGGHASIPGYGYNATPDEHYRHVWESINGAGSWNANPWVWVIEFRRLNGSSAAAPDAPPEAPGPDEQAQGAHPVLQAGEQA